MRFWMILLAGMSNMLSDLGDHVAHEIVRAVDFGALEFFGLLIVPTMVSTFRCCCSFQPSSSWSARKCRINDDMTAVYLALKARKHDTMHERHEYVQYALCKQRRRRLFLQVYMSVSVGRRLEKCSRDDRRPRNSTCQVPFTHTCTYGWVPKQTNVFHFTSRLMR